MVAGIGSIRNTSAISAYQNHVKTTSQTTPSSPFTDRMAEKDLEPAVVFEPSEAGRQLSDAEQKAERARQDEALMKRLPGTKSDNQDQEIQTEGKAELGDTPDAKQAEASEKPEESIEYRNQIQELVNREKEVIMHEQAHQSAGGEFTGAASYTYTTGPDGKRYISGGEVSINTPQTDDPEEAVRIMERVKAAALAPANPSGQDIKVAASAASKQMKAQMEISAKRAEKAYGETEEIKKAMETFKSTGEDHKPFDMAI